MGKIEKEKGLHHCNIFDLNIKWNEYRILFGGAVNDCYEHRDGCLYVDNDEYGNRVNYCPFCGYKAKKQMKFKCEKKLLQGYLSDEVFGC